MEVACFKYIKKELQLGTNWTILIEKRDGKKQECLFVKGRCGEDG